MYPVLFSVGRQVFYTYSVVMALTAGLILVWLTWAERRPGTGRLDAVLWAMLAAILGGRLGHVLANWEYFAEQPLAVLAVNDGGLSFHAGLLAAMAGLVIYARMTAASGRPAAGRLLIVASGLAPVLVMGLVGGWLACLLGGCAYGKAVPPPQRFYTFDWPDLFGVHAFRLPSQALGLLLALALLFAWIIVARRASDRHWPASRSACFAGLLLAIYGLGDFLIAFTRGDLRIAWGPLLAVQWADLAIVLAGLALVWRCRHATYNQHLT